MRRWVLFGRAPTNWWRAPVPAPKLCYRNKSAALRIFLDHNRHIVENYGGEDYRQSPAEFDAVNHKYGTQARSIVQAVWAALPNKRRPYCLTDIDLAALNDTSPAKEAGRNFELPEHVFEPPALPAMPRPPPKDWQARCQRWRRSHHLHRRQRTDQCFPDRYGHETCVCRYRGRFVSCGYVPGVPF